MLLPYDRAPGFGLEPLKLFRFSYENKQKGFVVSGNPKVGACISSCFSCLKALLVSPSHVRMLGLVFKSVKSGFTGSP